MAPYAASYPARTSEGDVGPVIVTLGLGPGQDFEEHMMEVDSFEEQVVNEIIHFRQDEVDLPTGMDGLVWEVKDTKTASLTVVLGEHNKAGLAAALARGMGPYRLFIVG